jgi:lysophospholipase L1-like esterase
MINSIRTARSIIIFSFLLIFAGRVLAQNENIPEDRRMTADRQKPLLNSENYIQRIGQLSNTLYRIKKEKVANVVFYGGSITHNPGWRELVMHYLEEQFPETKFIFLNAGIPSLGSLPHAFRIHHDLLTKGRADLVFLETAVNDRGNGTAASTQRRALEGIIRQLSKDNPYTEVVLMAFVDPEKIKDYQMGKVPAEVQLHEDIAKQFKFPFINLAKEVNDRIKANEFTWEGDFKNLHPSVFGQQVYFRTIKQLLSVEFEQQVPLQLRSASLPVQTDPLVYTAGSYLDIQQAGKLKGFALEANWRPTDSARARAGFVNIPVLSGSTPGDSFSLNFQGKAIGLAVLAGPDAGSVKYSIDGRDYPEIDLYTPWSKNLHLPWYVLLDDALSAGKHELMLQISVHHNESSKGTACRIAYFLINPASP